VKTVSATALESAVQPHFETVTVNGEVIIEATSTSFIPARDGRTRHDGSRASLNEGACAGDDRGVADLGCLSECSSCAPREYSKTSTEAVGQTR
jgi:hypothetical protein